ncbi:MAG: valine--tRNA ligase [Nanoarchaeota archaeon]|nr:valine--tRNA ligase [Nanoarchaeota archaeon]
MELPNKYDPKEAEIKWQNYWEKEGIYKFNPKTKKNIFSIDTPPPTVSGKMHVGHSFSYGQEDFVARYKRMKGFEVFFPFGTDDNGLATDRLIEKIKGVKSAKMDRKEYVKLCLKTLEEIRPDFIADWKRLGFSCDYDIYYSTIDAHSQKVSQESFIDLYEAGLEYRKEAPTLWCPNCSVALGQVELEDKELDSMFNDIVFKVGKENLVVATTRPELLPACVAVFYHPDDKRFQKYKGKKAIVPLFNHEVPILPDPRADPEKGTGIVMCCTFGDQTDMEWYFAHNLPLREAITPNGKMSKLAGKFEGLSIKDARKDIIEEMKKQGLLLKQKPIKHAVNVHERCGIEIEILHSKQWFIKYLDKKEIFIKAGNEINWKPKHMKNRYDNWIEGLQWDWCISRQRNFGIPIPVWYCKKCDEILLPNKKDLPVDPLTDKPPKACPKCKSKEFIPEGDVLDTWATSSLTPQIAARLVPGMYDKLYPMDFRQNGHDIITFWLFNTVVKSQLHNNVNPWKDVIITGWVLDPHGKKMSKSKGNVVDPREVWNKYSVDAQRFAASSTKLGEDYPFQEKDVLTGKKTVNKLFNASKFGIMHLEDYDEKKKVDIKGFDLWLLTKLNKTINNATKHFDVYHYSKAKFEVEIFFWQNFCDVYLEVVKDRLYNPELRGKENKNSAQFVVCNSIDSTLKMFAPIMPYITEEIYQMYFAKKDKLKSIHQSSWPKSDTSYIDEDVEKIGDELVDIISQVRKAKSEKGLSLKTPVKEIILNMNTEVVADFIEDFASVTQAEKVSFGKKLVIKL